jgi:zinc transport system substrate-binding protein
MVFMIRVCRALTIASLTALAAAGCGSGAATDGTAAEGKVAVSAAFYPLQFAAERVGGDLVHVTPLTKPGAEPHDLELAPKEVADLQRADLVVYEKGFQPAIDEAVDSLDKGVGFDVSTAADLSLEPTEHEGHDHAETGPDPHFWLDPTRLGKVATALATELATKDPANATAYKTNAETLVGELTTLDGEFKAGLATCASKDLVVSHAAFAYLADRYGLHQEAINGISPDVEPNAATMARIVTHVKEAKVSTIYAETLTSPAIAETLARETGAKVAILDPIEGITKESKGANYLEIMRSNLATLKVGQQC